MDQSPNMLSFNSIELLSSVACDLVKQCGAILGGLEVKVNLKLVRKTKQRFIMVSDHEDLE
jgi:hypothetical protein